NASKVKADLVKYRRKFIYLIEAYYYYYKGQAFFMHKEKLVGFSVNSRIIINAAFF
ncbi:hypothetical protein K469DRAFT_609090, partial [Zopfia rhizophila CBS 207.26]